MNFKFTPKSTAIFIAGLVLAGMVAAYFDSPMSGMGLVLGTIAYLSQAEKR
jgi:hypothetical protein